MFDTKTTSVCYIQIVNTVRASGPAKKTDNMAKDF